ncbi:MAG TPA: DUF3185 family protein [Sulfurimonas sp.]|nr:DUF3185 family protein [Sulfurimonas sp.]
MSKNKIIGIASLVLALIAAYMGYSQSQGISASLSNEINASLSNKALIKYTISIVFGVIGLILIKR